MKGSGVRGSGEALRGTKKIRRLARWAEATAVSWLAFLGTGARSGESWSGTQLPVMVEVLNQGVYPPLPVHPFRDVP